MNPNPFKPTAGKRPPILIGRESVIEDFEEGLDNGAGAPGRLMLITGNRGCGSCNVWPASADGRLSPILLRLAYATAWPTRFARINPL